ncbi:MAG: hypothetical protein OXC10_01370 [Rhodospirillaceae bacterium]|nr:hypothetical protein [Rhodospirillaceae bacterium]
MKVVNFLICIAVAVALAACGGRGDAASGIERQTSFDGEVLRIAVNRKDGGKEKFNSLRDEWYSFPWAPFIPNHAGRRWALVKTLTEGISLAYVLVSWDNDDPSDYLAAGYWLHFPGATRLRNLPLSQADVSAFVDGPEIDPSNPPQLPVSGRATYIGNAGGVYSYRYGRNWADVDASVSTEEFVGTITLMANFGDNTISGCIGCVGDIEITREHLYSILGWRAQLPKASPKDYELHFGRTKIGADGAFASTDVAVTHPERSVTGSDGQWSGRLSNRSATDGNPRLAAGSTDVRFGEADGSSGSFSALFTGSLVPQKAN